MAQTTVNPGTLRTTSSGGRMKFIIGGVLIAAAIIYLIVSTLQSTAQYFYTVDEIIAKGPSIAGQNLRASGAVLGDSITYAAATLTITFEMAHVSADQKDIDAQGGLAVRGAAAGSAQERGPGHRHRQAGRGWRLLRR